MRRALGGRASLGALLVAISFGGLGGCSSGTDTASTDGDANGAQCQTTKDFFETEVWSPFMGQVCYDCHGPGGKAQQQNAKFLLQPAASPDFIDQNLANIKTVISYEFNGVPEILVKPVGGANHGGGAVISADGPEIQALTQLVQKIQQGDGGCVEAPNSTIAAVKLLGPTDTFRKAALDLGGRLPTATETAAIAKGGDAALDTALDELMTEDTFLQRLREIWGDILLTDKYYLSYSGAAIDSLNEQTMYPALAPYKDPNNPKYMDPNRPLINQAIAQEPLNLIAYIVKNELPFTDVAAADYTVVNPFLATAYGVTDVQFTDPTDYNEWHPAHVTLGTGTALPHAGILSTPVFLNRWQTTPTNRDRGRARRVLLFLLATDILQIATRPIDPTAITQDDNPTLDDPLCTVCHTIIDPLAGGFRGYDPYDYESFDPDVAISGWYTDMAPTGYDGTNMDPSQYATALPWLASQVAADPRFITNAVNVIYTGFTGRTPILYPQDNTDPNFVSNLAAWTAQDAFLTATGQAFTKSHMNLKTIVKAVVKSAYYRGSAAGSSTADPVLLTDVGGGRLLTPEMLSRKVSAVVGFSWHPNWDATHDYLAQDYRITYGGIDCDSVTTRLTTPNGIMSAVQSRLASEMACHATAFDFTKPAADRLLFPNVELAEVPESAGNTVSGSVDDIKANIVYLHQQILGETLSTDDPEVQRTYQVFLDTWHELSESGVTSVNWECEGRWDWTDDSDLSDDVIISDDQNFTMRSWQAVVTYLLSDYSFLYQ
ncbi:MAG TPA: hypothetical protein VGM56_04710 [Byssovorax sp.]